MSMTWVSRVVGAGGENCQCKVARPPFAAQNVTLAMRKSPGPQPVGQLLRAPEANAMEPGGVYAPRSMQAPGPLQTSFCRTTSNIVLSAVSVAVSGMDVQFP